MALDTACRAPKVHTEPRAVAVTAAIWEIPDETEVGAAISVGHAWLGAGGWPGRRPRNGDGFVHKRNQSQRQSLWHKGRQ